MLYASWQVQEGERFKMLPETKNYGRRFLRHRGPELWQIQGEQRRWEQKRR
jgi:hypothetical protein